MSLASSARGAASVAAQLHPAPSCRLTWRVAQTTPTRAQTSHRRRRRVQAVRRSHRAARLAARAAEPRFLAAAPGYGAPAAAAVPSRGLDRLLQAARERKKQQSGTGARFAPRRGVAREAHGPVLRAAVVDTAAAPPSNRVPWRSRLSAANATFPDSPERQHWLLQLMLTAKGADVERSRQLLQDMSLDGYPPGPREFHIAVATHALAGDAVGALRVMQDQHARGGRALFETCAASPARSHDACADTSARAQVQGRHPRGCGARHAGRGRRGSGRCVLMRHARGTRCAATHKLRVRVMLQLLRAPGTTTRRAGGCW